MLGSNALYAQSGGVTPVINVSAYGCLQAAQQSRAIQRIFCGINGINGVIEDALFEATALSTERMEALRNLPAAAFGSCRRKLKDPADPAFDAIFRVLAAHDIGYFFYNGGNDSMDSVAKLHQIAQERHYPLRVLGIPKTIDNDLPHTDTCPGFGSVAKYNAISMREASLDTLAMCHDSTKVFVLETMGRHAGWLAAATALASTEPQEGPHLLLLPEVPFQAETFLQAVQDQVTRHGHCCIAVSEGLRDSQGRFLTESGQQDAFGHAQLGGVGLRIQELIRTRLNLKTHGAVLDYCQRSARHCASQTDVNQAESCGRYAVKLAENGESGLMVTLVRQADAPYRWTLGSVAASKVANQERTLPAHFIRTDGYHVTEAFRSYCRPLIQGEAYPPYAEGMPLYRPLSLPS